ncbi:HD domain-containing phosphohydrolase [Desulfuribacillus alkaliarsenatis]|uniref:Diguanylate cyclase n=1 Tax=Desulfuribacillus alkaliarsenatis TaxID=766136 RepID=A0A1E5FZ15_9FIRM|nr:HD domain-containing phosphohydrolase [Desulfuribacillus alkaliarsenatis]OEF95813.1 hypothetical protein BHF68_10450 [Desulfuribacillus alkaliarsenatis]
MDFSIFLYILLLAVFLYLIIAGFALKYREVEGAYGFSVLMIATAVYCLGYFFQLQSTDEQAVTTWINFQYIGAASIPGIWLVFVIRYCGLGYWLTPGKMIGIGAIPAITVLSANSTFVDSWLYSGVQLEFVEGITLVKYNLLFGYYIFFVYALLSVLIGLALLIYSYFKFKQDNNSKRFLLLSIGAAVPLLAYIVSVTSTSSLNLDLVPLSSLLTAFIYLYNVYTYEMFRSVSISKDVIYNTLQDAIIVTNDKHCITEMNHTAQKYFGELEKVIGKSIDEILSKIDAQGVFRYQGQALWFSIKVNPIDIFDNRDSLTNNNLYILRDVTDSVLAQQALYESEEKYRTLFDHMQEGFAFHEIICDEQGQAVDYRFLDVNPSFERITGLQKEQIVGQRVLDILPNTESYWIEEYGKVALQGTSITFENYSIEVEKYFSVTAFSPQHGQFAVIFFDITDRVLLEKATFKEKERLRTTLMSVGDGVIVTDKQANVVMLNNVAQTLTGYSEEEAAGMPFSKVFTIINQETKQKCKDPVELVLKSGKIETLEENTLLIAKDGTKTMIADSAAPILVKNVEIQGVVVVFRDITEEFERQEQITYLSYHDQLTGLYNRRYFEEQLKRVDTERNLPLSMIVIDVNSLKLINDSFGHTMGDKLIQKTAEILRSACRADEIIARWGGDEFVVLLPNTALEQVASVGERIIQLTKEFDFAPVLISLSVGWATKLDSCEDTQEIFKQAEDRMYRHKLLYSDKIKRQIIEKINQHLHRVSKDEEQHALRVAKLCTCIAEKLVMPREDKQDLITAAKVHDIGKIAINTEILDKAGPLSEEEWIEMKRHPEVGFRILSAVNDFSNIAEIVLSHHEHWDGSGYPKGLRGKEIPIHSRVLSVAEAFDSMTHNSSYRKAISEADALRKLQEQAGKQFDPEVVKLLSEIINNDIC